ncbi:MAG: hypothetical protein WB562_04040 [Candidatus Sulfotelmatobacter sp.]
MKSSRLILAVIVPIVIGSPAKTSTASPKEIVEQFVKMDVEGERLTPEGWRTADALFAKHSEPFQPQTIVVVGRNYAVSTETEQGNTNEFYFGYEEVARVSTSSLRFASTNSGVETRTFLKYSVVSTRIDRIQGNTKHSAEGMPSEWKIDGAQPTTTHLTAKAAIRFVTQRRTNMSDPVIQKNADLSISGLGLISRTMIERN